MKHVHAGQDERAALTDTRAPCALKVVADIARGCVTLTRPGSPTYQAALYNKATRKRTVCLMRREVAGAAAARRRALALGGALLGETTAGEALNNATALLDCLLSADEVSSAGRPRARLQAHNGAGDESCHPRPRRLFRAQAGGGGVSGQGCACRGRADAGGAAARLVSTLPSPRRLAALALTMRRLHRSYAVYLRRLIALLCRADASGERSEPSLHQSDAPQSRCRASPWTLSWRRVPHARALAAAHL